MNNLKDDNMNIKLATVFNKNELTVEEAFEKAKLVLDKKQGFVQKFLKLPNFNDEPKYFFYTAYTKKSSLHPSFTSGGCSLNETKAQMKALVEAIERYSVYLYERRKFLRTSYTKINNKALDPTTITSFSETQLKTKRFKFFRVGKNSILKWICGTSLISGKPVLIPAQLTSLSYEFEENEPLIRIPITTGIAASTSMAGGIVRGIWENVERDAFMITYLNKLKRDRIIIDDSHIEYILSLFSRYKLEVYFFDITTDIGIPVILSVIIDRTSKGPAVCIGIKCSLDVKEALIGSLEEAAMTRLNRRKIFITENIKPKRFPNGHKDRALYWSHPKMIKHLNFLIKSENCKDFTKIKNYKGNTISNLKKTIKILKKKNIETVFVDITKPLIRKYEFHVAMVSMPELQPLYLSERYPYFGGRRLYTVPKNLGYTDKETTEDELNKIPHPF